MYSYVYILYILGQSDQKILRNNISPNVSMSEEKVVLKYFIHKLIFAYKIHMLICTYIYISICILYARDALDTQAVCNQAVR